MELALKGVDVVFSGQVALGDTESMTFHPENVAGQASAWLHLMVH